MSVMQSVLLVIASVTTLAQPVASVAMASGSPRDVAGDKPTRHQAADPVLDAAAQWIAERDPNEKAVIRARALLVQARQAFKRGDKTSYERLRGELSATMRDTEFASVKRGKLDTGKSPLPAANESQRLQHPTEDSRALPANLQDEFDRVSANWPGVRSLYAEGRLLDVQASQSGQVLLKFEPPPSAISESSYFVWARQRAKITGVQGLLWVTRSDEKPFSGMMDADSVFVDESGLLLHPAVPLSPVIRSVTVTGPPHVVRDQRGNQSHGDIWVNTWADDGHLYTAWGDGRGFGNPYITDLGYGRLRGDLPDLLGEVLYVDDNLLAAETKDTSENDKPSSLLAYNSRLYAHQHRPLGDPEVGYLAVSDDNGRTWQRFIADSPWTRENRSMFRCMYFINMGKNYDLDEDGFVYALGTGKEYFWSEGGLYLARVPLPHILSYDHYAYFADLSQEGATWSRQQTDAIPLRGIAVREQVSAMFHPGLGRYLLLTAEYLFDAPAPWGPWTLAGRWRDHAPPGWDGGYMPQLIAKGADDASVWFAIAGGSMTDQADRPGAINYRLHIGQLHLVRRE